MIEKARRLLDNGAKNILSKWFICQAKLNYTARVSYAVIDKARRLLDNGAKNITFKRFKCQP